MLEDLSAHILDIGENSVRGESSNIILVVEVMKSKNILSLSVSDDGCGMSPDFVIRVTDPFTTTKETRRVGMGLPFLKQSAEQCDGAFSISSEVGKGTVTTASFRLDNIDTPPLGDIAESIMILVTGSPEIHWIYRHVTDNGIFVFDSEEIIEALGGGFELLTTPDVALWIKAYISEGISAI